MKTSSLNTKRPGDGDARPFLGWRVVTASFLAEMVSTGCMFSAFGVFVVPLAEAFDTTRGTISSGAGLMLLVSGLIGPVLGRAIDRGYVRALMVSGVFVMTAGMVLVGLFRNFTTRTRARAPFEST